MSNFNKTESEGWDTGYVFEWSLDYYDYDGNRTKTKPAPEIVRTGLHVREPWARIWHNSALFNYAQYIKWMSGEPVIERGATEGDLSQVENFEPVGTIKQINQTVRTAASDPNGGNFTTFTTADAKLYWGGTWTESTSGDITTFTKTAIDVHPEI